MSACTIYSFHHDSELFPDVQYAEACTPFALEVTVKCPEFENNEFKKNHAYFSQMFFIIIQLCMPLPVSRLVTQSNSIQWIEFD